jgi:hypothetical protein
VLPADKDEKKYGFCSLDWKKIRYCRRTPVFLHRSPALVDAALDYCGTAGGSSDYPGAKFGSGALSVPIFLGFLRDGERA